MIGMVNDKSFGLFDKLLSSNGKLVRINSSNPESILDKLGLYQDYTGKAVYFWKSGRGLYRADLPSMYAPHSERLDRALMHISTSIHFGIYVFDGITDSLKDPNVIRLLERIHSKQFPHKQLLLFVDEKVSLPEELEPLFKTIEHKPAAKIQAA